MRIVLEDAPPLLRSFGQAGVDADFDGEDEGAVVGADLVDEAAGELGAVVDHGEEEAEGLDAASGVPAHALGGGDHVAESGGGEELRGGGEEEGVGGDDGVGRHDGEAGGAIQEDVVVGVGDRLEDGAETEVTASVVAKLGVGVHQVDRGGDQAEVGDAGGADDVVGSRGVQEEVGGGGGELVGRDAQGQRGGGLAVQVHQEDAAVALGQSGGEVHRRGRFAHAPLAADDGRDHRVRWIMAAEQ